MSRRELTPFQKGARFFNGEDRFRLMVVLLDYSDWFTQKELGRAGLNIAGPTISRNLKWLEDLGALEVDKSNNLYLYRRTGSKLWDFVQEIADSQTNIPDTPSELT